MCMINIRHAVFFQRSSYNPIDVFKAHTQNIYVPCFYITRKNLSMTFEEGRTRTWRLPRFSALTMLLRLS
ncbi:hypothetical protein RIR_jg23805.t1 [Rhizophagus irregularis DAOM 181602=DAOM 197198]|nr:hypothetical protein RIR_jg23805.t1 [Rhizophagus irregularis DAOM 181602=DAOM 197198]